MKTFPHILLTLLLSAVSCFAQGKISSDDINSAKTYTPEQFVKSAGDVTDGTLVRIKFNYRSPSITMGPNGMKIGRIQARDVRYDYYAYNSFGGVQVLVPQDGMAWFQHVNTFHSADFDRNAVKSYVVYGKVKSGAGGPSIVLVGSEVKHDDLDGDSLIWH